MNMANCACKLNLIKVITLCCGCYRCTSHYITHRCSADKQYMQCRGPTACGMLPVLHANPCYPKLWHCNIACSATTLQRCNITLHQAWQPFHVYIQIHCKPNDCTVALAATTVVNPTSAAALQQLGCVNTFYNKLFNYVLFVSKINRPWGYFCQAWNLSRTQTHISAVSSQYL